MAEVGDCCVKKACVLCDTRRGGGSDLECELFGQPAFLRGWATFHSLGGGGAVLAERHLDYCWGVATSSLLLDNGTPQNSVATSIWALVSSGRAVWLVRV